MSSSLPLGFGIVFTLITALFCYLLYHNYMHASNLDKRGLVVEAEIIKKFEQSTTASSTSSFSNNPKFRGTGPTSYFVEYEYETLDHQIILGKANVGKEYQESIKVGDFYNVKYDPKNPDISIMSDIDSYRRGVKTLMLLIGVFSIPSLVSWWFYLKVG